MKYCMILITILSLAACSGLRSSPPHNLDNACSMLAEKRGWSRDLKAAERKYGVPREIILATIYHESGFVARAKTSRKYLLGIIPLGRRSSAYGYAQAIDGTWNWYKKSTRQRIARRNRFGDSVDFIAWYMDITNKRNGVSKRDAYNQYLAYHQGHAGFKRGSYKSMGWLKNVARNVRARAKMYARQLATCPKR